MTIRTFFGRLRRKIIRLLLGRQLFTQITTVHDRIDELQNAIINELGQQLNGLEQQLSGVRQQLNGLEQQLSGVGQQLNGLEQQSYLHSYNINKIESILLLKEQSPELLHKFASGLKNDERLIKALAKTNIFHQIQLDFYLNSRVFGECFSGGGCIPFDILKDNLISMAENPIMRAQALLALINLSWSIYQDDERARMIEKIYDSSLLDTESWISLQYVAFLLIRKEEEKALNILNEYLKRYPVEKIVEFLPVADLAHRHGITNEDIAAASELFNVIIQNSQNNIYKNYIEKYGKDASIAIVGNGPYELGKGKGKEIDAHDIVLRCNCYNISEEYNIDYGKKVNIVIFAPSAPENSNLFDRKIDLFISHSVYSENFSLDIIKKFKEKPFKNIVTLELTNLREEIYNKYNINWPSVGFRAVFYFKSMLRKKIDIYGISISKGIIVNGHYENRSIQSIVPYHNLERELEAMQDMFKADGDKD